jgi:hypothetical protein
MLAPLRADLFLYSCEANVMQRLLMESEKKLAQTLFMDEKQNDIE